MKLINLIIIFIVLSLKLNGQQAGDLDTTFSTLAGGSGPYIFSIGLQPDGEVLIGGWFEQINGITTGEFARLTANGDLDTAFNNALHSSTGGPHSGISSGGVWSINVLPDGKIIVGGSMVYISPGVSQYGIIRLLSNGAVDTNFVIGLGANTPGNAGIVYTTQFLQDGKIFLAGKFNNFDLTPKNNLARINYNGSIDSAFNSGSGTNDFINTSVLQPDGKIVIGGGFTVFNGDTVNYITRLNTDGSRDSSFNTGIGANSWVRCCALQPDGKIIVTGDFSSFNGTSKSGIVRLNTNGTIDNTFDIGTGANDYILALEIQSNGKILIGGGLFFTSFNGTPVPKIARLNIDGSVDTTFHTGTGVNTWVHQFKVQPDGKILMAGNYDTYNGIFTSRIARIYGDPVANNCFSFNLFFNSVSPIGCLDSIASATATPFFGHPPYQYSWNTSPLTATQTLNVTISGLYTATVTDTLGCSKTATLFINAPPPSNYDLVVNLSSASFVPGTYNGVMADVENIGCSPISGKLKLVFDSLLIPISSVPPADIISGDTIIWNFNGITFDTIFNHPVVNCYAIPNSTIGMTTKIKVIAEPISGDLNPGDNFKTYSYPIVSSYDPNDKTVYPKGDCDLGYIPNTQDLTYTLRFENTGNSNAINVILTDTLSPNLDITTLKILTTSHIMHTEIESGNVLKFVFNNINLPYAPNLNASNRGYVVYKINPVQGLIDGAIIENKASIFFDTNLPIITNTVSNVISSINLIPDTSIAQNGNILTSNAVGANYQWINCTDGTAIAGATNQNFIATVSGNYAVTIISNGCSATSDCYNVSFTGLNDNSYTKVKLISSQDCKSENISFILQNALKGVRYQILLVNSVGQLILSNNFNSGKVFLDTKGIAKGMYLTRVLENGKNILNTKVSIL